MGGVPFGDFVDDVAADYEQYIRLLCTAIIDGQARGNEAAVELGLVLLEAELLSLNTEAN